MPANVRGRAACKQCRSRKQKCDEKRPTCSRCRDLNKPCQWPGLRKRGPAKGYTEALEHRLRETESALLRIISVVDGATLSSAFADSMASGIIDTHPDTNTDKAEMAAHWEQFPLSTSGDIINWANEQQASQTLLAGGAAPRTTHALETANAQFREQLSGGDTSMIFETTKGVAAVGQTSTDSSISPGLLPQGSWNSDPQNDTFDMPEHFKEQFIW